MHVPLNEAFVTGFVVIVLLLFLLMSVFVQALC